MGEDEHGIVVGNVLADEILLDALSVRDGKLKVGAFGIKNVHIKMPAPAVLDHRAAMGFSGVALAGVGGVAFYDRAVHGLNHRLPEVGAEEVLVARLAGMQLDGDAPAEFLADGAVQRDNALGRNVSGKIDGCFHCVILLEKF